MPRSTTEAMRPWRWRWALAALLVLLLGAGCTTLDEQQRKWLLLPTAQSQGWWGGSSEGMQDVWIEHRPAGAAQPVRLHALWFAQADAAAPVLLYLHGARRTVEGSAFRIRHLHDLGFSVLAIDYRGFGKSSVALPSETMVHEDARAAWDWLARAHPQRPRFIYGHSLGGAVAVRLAAEVGAELRGLIVEGSFTSIPAVFRTLQWGWLPITPLITQRFDAARRIGGIKAPVLVVHGGQDRLIAPELGRELYERAPEPKRFVLVEGGTHYSTSGVGREQVRQAMAELFAIGATP
jgi:alpha-beta hydrolase superfamily lysophospholipase